MKQANVTIGILGGMGPEASAEFHRQLIERNPASRDQDHFRILLLDDPRIPDRTSFIHGIGEDPRPALAERARQLQSYGVSFIAVPCNTAHVFWDAIQGAVTIPVLHIVEITVRSIPERFGPVGLLSTSGTISGGLYAKELAERGIDGILPDAAQQAEIDRLIDSVKAGEDRSRQIGCLEQMCVHLRERGAGGVILGCTELGLLASSASLNLEVFDSLGLLAEATLERARRLQDEPLAAVGS